MGWICEASTQMGNRSDETGASLAGAESRSVAGPAGDHPAAWPRPLIADGRAEPLAVWWRATAREAAERGLPAFARHALTRKIEDGLFDARRARRLVRGLESACSALASEQAGLDRTAAARPEAGAARISRLLVVSADGSERFYREVESLRRRFAQRLEVLVLDCDESALGACLFGRGRRARAVLLGHKDAVVRLCTTLCDEILAEGSDISS